MIGPSYQVDDQVAIMCDSGLSCGGHVKDQVIELTHRDVGRRAYLTRSANARSCSAPTFPVSDSR